MITVYGHLFTGNDGGSRQQIHRQEEKVNETDEVCRIIR